MNDFISINAIEKDMLLDNDAEFRFHIYAVPINDVKDEDMHHFTASIDTEEGSRPAIEFDNTVTKYHSVIIMMDYYDFKFYCSKEELEDCISCIDKKVSRLEKSNDDYMVKYGTMDDDIYHRIQDLMDFRDFCHSLSLNYHQEDLRRMYE